MRIIKCPKCNTSINVKFRTSKMNYYHKLYVSEKNKEQLTEIIENMIDKCNEYDILRITTLYEIKDYINKL